MYHIDTAKIRGIMAEREITIAAAAKQMNLSRPTLSKYLKNPETMRLQTLVALGRALKLSDAEEQAIFFANRLTRTQEGERPGRNDHL